MVSKKVFLMFLMMQLMLFSISLDVRSYDWPYFYLPDPSNYVSPVSGLSIGQNITLEVKNTYSDIETIKIINGVKYSQVTNGTLITAKVVYLPEDSADKHTALFSLGVTYPNGSKFQLGTVNMSGYDWPLSVFLFKDWDGWKNYFNQWNSNQSTVTSSIYNYQVIENDEYFGFYSKAYSESGDSNYRVLKTIQSLNWYNKNTGALLYVYGFLNNTIVNSNEGKVIKEIMFYEVSSPDFTPPFNPLKTNLASSPISQEFLPLKFEPFIIGLSILSLLSIKRKKPF